MTSQPPPSGKPKPKLSEDEIDDLVYLARAGEDSELADMLAEIVAREGAGATKADVLEAARDDGGATCLHMAAANGHSKTVTLILSYLPMNASSSASSNSTPRASDSSEQHATSTPVSSSEEAKTDKEAGPEPEPSYIDAKNAFGNTALHWACLGGHLDVVKLLLSRGARPAAVNDKDQIPLDLAAFNSHMHVVDYFLAQTKDIEGGNGADSNGSDGLAGAVNDVEMGGDDTGGEAEAAVR